MKLLASPRLQRERLLEYELDTTKANIDTTTAAVVGGGSAGDLNDDDTIAADEESSSLIVTSWLQLATRFLNTARNKIDSDRILWLSSTVFLRISDGSIPNPIPLDDFTMFGVRMVSPYRPSTSETRRSKWNFLIYRNTSVASNDINNDTNSDNGDERAFEFLGSLNLAPFVGVVLWDLTRGEHPLALPPQQLAMFVRPELLRVSFLDIRFTAEQSRALIVPYINLDLDKCTFEDDGKAFVEEIEQSDINNPFILESVTLNDERTLRGQWLIRFLQAFRGNNRLLCHISLAGFTLDPIMCQEIIQSNIGIMDLVGCQLEDHGDSLIDKVRRWRERTLPRIEFKDGGSRSLFETTERWLDFADALRSSRSLRHLTLDCNFRGVDWSTVYTTLVSSISQNSVLESLKIHLPGNCQSCWKDIWKAASVHPSLQKLRVQCQWDYPNLTTEKKKERTRFVGRLLGISSSLHDIDFIGDEYDSHTWDKCVVPVLEWKRLQPKIALLTATASLRAGLLGQAIGSVSKKTHLVWSLLKANQDVVASQLEIYPDNQIREETASVAPRARKRRRIV